MRLPEVEIGRKRFMVFPNKYAILFIVWHSRNSTLQLYRLSLITYLSSHIIRYTYEIPPIISQALINDVSSLINEGLLELATLNGRLVLRVTEVGRRMIGNFYGYRNELVVVGDYLLVKLSNLLNELSRIVNTYQYMDSRTLLSIALREESLREKGLMSSILRDLAFDLRNTCENALG
jgi:hypothetical protein